MRMIFLLGAVLAFFLAAGCATVQRRLLFQPSHNAPNPSLAAWKHGDQLIGYAHTVPTPHNVWLLIHGNGGQASHRTYALASFSASDSVYILEYPGYGQREGKPSRQSFNAAARAAYEILRADFPHTPVCVVGESIGTGPVCFVANNPHPPDKIVLVVPFDILATVVPDHIPFFPARLLLRDNWNNLEALKGYDGPLEIFAATDDTIIPIRHAKALAAGKPKSIFHEIPGGHNDWPNDGRVSIRNP